MFNNRYFRGIRPAQHIIERVTDAFDRDALKRICEMHETDFPAAFGLDVTNGLPQKAPSDWYGFKDNGSNVLAVAHLDTVAMHADRTCNFVECADGTVVFSRALDDRLGAYIILELLPALGITHDILLTVGEEQGQSTALFFEPPAGKQYDWMIEFDRGGTDTVMYQYEEPWLVDLVERSGSEVGSGSFSDISYLEHLGIKGFNWGVGYQEYHYPRAHAFLDDTFSMVGKYLDFHGANEGVLMEHGEEVWETYDPENPDDIDYIENPTLEDHEALERALNYFGRDPALRDPALRSFN